MFNIKNLLLTIASVTIFSVIVFGGIKKYKDLSLSTLDTTNATTTEQNLEANFPSDSDVVITKKSKTTQTTKTTFKPEYAYNYKVKGKKYSTFANSEGFKQVGTASWYGGAFHGKKTANGERYNMNALTGAHKNLPLVTYAKVINLENNKSVVIKINDRGPFHGNRILDLSRAAAQKLGMVHKGTTKVQVIAL